MTCSYYNKVWLLYYTSKCIFLKKYHVRTYLKMTKNIHSMFRYAHTYISENYWKKSLWIFRLNSQCFEDYLDSWFVFVLSISSFIVLSGHICYSRFLKFKVNTNFSTFWWCQRPRTYVRTYEYTHPSGSTTLAICWIDNLILEHQWTVNRPWLNLGDT